MKTTQTPAIILLTAGSALVLLCAGVQLAVSAIAIGGILAIAFSDYRREIKPLPMPMAEVISFRAAETLRHAA